MQTNVPKFRCEQKDICVWFEWVNSLWRMWNNRWGPILLYWRLIIIHVYTHWQPHCSTLNTTPERRSDIESFPHKRAAVVSCEGWEFSPTDVDWRRCHGLISDQLYIFFLSISNVSRRNLCEKCNRSENVITIWPWISSVCATKVWCQVKKWYL